MDKDEYTEISKHETISGVREQISYFKEVIFCFGSLYKSIIIEVNRINFLNVLQVEKFRSKYENCKQYTCSVLPFLMNVNKIRETEFMGRLGELKISVFCLK